MTTYRVGSAGATVFNADGWPLVRLRPGSVVVEGVTETCAVPVVPDHKRVRGYADKRITPAEDKTVSQPTYPDPTTQPSPTPPPPTDPKPPAPDDDDDDTERLPRRR